MGIFQTLTSTVGILALAGLFLFILFRYIGGWTRVRAWIWPTQPDDKMGPSNSEMNMYGGGSFRRLENAECGRGTSSAASDGRGIAMKNLNPSNNNNNNNSGNGSRQQWPGQFVPPPPLRPPSMSTGPPNYLPNQGSSVDSVYFNPLASPGGIPPRLPPPPNGGGGRRGSGSTGSGTGIPVTGPSTNPFIPLIQASTQFFSQTIQSFQNTASPPTNANPNTTNAAANGISMGELLFSAPSASANRNPSYQQEQTDKYSLITFNDAGDGGGQLVPQPVSGAYPSGSGNGAYPISPPSTHHPIQGLGRSQHQQKQIGRVLYEDENNMILIETSKDMMDRASGLDGLGSPSGEGDVGQDGVFNDDENQRRDSLLESMRAEIRLENERMEDATKSLLMGDDATTFKRGSGGRTGSVEDKYSVMATGNNTSASSFLSRPAASDRKYSAPEIGAFGVIQSQREVLATKPKTIDEMGSSSGAGMNDDDEGSLLDYVRARKASIEQYRANNNNNAAYGAVEVGSANNGIPTLLAAAASLTDRDSSCTTSSSSTCSSSSKSKSKSNCRSNGSFSSSSSSTHSASASAPTASQAPAPASAAPTLQPPHKVVVPIVQIIPSCTSPSFILGPSSTSPAYQQQRARSFSLRQQSSVDSIGDISDLMSPESGNALPVIQRAMSCDSVCSDTSVILGELDPPHVTGQLFVGLEYDSETADLIVNVIEGKDLLGLDPDPTCPFDSYVRVYLLPDKTTTMQTRVYRKSLTPVYKEKFMFGLDETELPSRSLVFYLYATNKHSNTLIGEAELKLNELDLGQPKLTWLQLTDTGKRGGELGEIMFSLSYLPTAERLTVVVVKARNLKFPHGHETGDPFVKVYLLQKGKKVSKKKSSTKRNERNPIFNEAMIFSVPTHALQTIQLRITVSDSSESEGRAYSIGHIIIGSASTGKPLSHWSQMLSSLRKPIAMWHSLRK